MHHRLLFRRYRAAFRLPLVTARGRWREREGLIVRLEDERGRVGWGEAAPIPWFGGESAGEDERACGGLGASLSASAISELPAKFACLKRALSDAVEELESGALVAAPGRESLPVAALLPAGPGAPEAARRRAAEGFACFKWKVGVGDSAGELAILDDLCGELPSCGRLRLDANGAWDRRRAEKWLARCADRPVEYVEQPTAADARGADDLLLGLAGDYPTPIGLDESIAGSESVERWLAAGWKGVYVIKPSLLADPGDSLRKLEAAGASVVFSSALETAVGARSSLRTAFAWKGPPRALGFGVWPLFADPRLDGPTAAPQVRRQDVERLDPDLVWTALS